MTSADPPALPPRIGKYRITRLLGRGAMGVVYEGFDPHIQRAVALKTIHKALLQGDEGAAVLSARFRNEAQAVGRLSHPGIVAIYEYGEDEQQAYIAMEYVPGQDLGQWLARAGAVPPPQAAALMAQLLAALECAHRAGVWHRDLKPANLLLGADGRLKLGDFGIARVAGVGLTQGLVAIGTPGYMAPEQYRGEDVDHRADLYAAGVLLYRLLTGRQPFSGSAETLMYKTLNEPAPPPSGVSPQPLGAAHDALLARALAKAPAERFQSAQAFAQALAACLGSDAVADPDATVVRPPPPLATANAAGLAAGSAANVGSVAGAALGAGAGVGAGSSPGSQSGATVASSPALPSSWDAAAAQRVERALAQQVGPIARVMLRQAAAHAASLDGLVHALAAQLEPGQRAAFEDAALGGRRATPVPAATAASAAAGPASDGAVVPVSAADLSHALAVMTRRVGPIARILIKRATERSRDRAQWLELLLAGCEEADRAALRSELGEPRS